MNTTNTQVDNGELQETLREANRLWRRAGVRGPDRKMMLSELEAEIDGALRDGHDASAVLGEDSSRTLRQWADERGLCGRALRLELVVPAVVLGAAAGLAVILVAVFAGFAGRPTVDLGPLVLPMYASSGAFAYLCALLFVWITLVVIHEHRRRFGGCRYFCRRERSSASAPAWQSHGGGTSTRPRPSSPWWSES